MRKLKFQIAMLALSLIAALVAKHYVDRYLSYQGGASFSSSEAPTPQASLEVEAPAANVDASQPSKAEPLGPVATVP